jgi:two-component system, NtrC family, sensor histidine kinase HydH
MGRRPDVQSRRHGLAREARRIAALLIIVVAIRLTYSMTDEPAAIRVGVLLRLYYIPILVSAYWYGPFGGLLMAVAASVAYAPHLRENPALEQGRFAEIVFFHVIGLVVGLLAMAQRRVTVRYQRAAATLEEANLQLRASFERLQRADRLKTLGEVAAGLAHEIRHPLASIRGALEIIDSRARPDSPEAEFSRLAMAEVQRLDHLVWEFLRYARPHEPELRPTSLHDVVLQVAALLRAQAERAGVTLNVDRQPVLPPVTLDALQIEQVLLNVILNAIQASRPNSEVRVRELQEGDEAIIEVIDDGPGIPPEQMTQIFAPFFTTKDTGTGLGLPIAQRIVLAHRGRLQVESTSGHGTAVRVRLPIRTDAAAVAEAAGVGAPA